MNRLIKCMLLFALLLVTVTCQSNAQKIFEGSWIQTSETKSSVPGAPAQDVKKQQVFFKADKMKTVDLNTGDMMILRLDKELMWNVNKAKGTYTEVKFSEVQSGMKEMQAEMKKMSAEERKMMKKMMGGKMNSIMGEEGKMNISIKKTGERKTIGGFKCKKYVYYLDNDPMVDFWMTDKYQLGSEFVEVYQKMGMFKGNITEESKKMKGFPIQTHSKIETGMGKFESVVTVTKITPKSISNSEFNLPKGLKKQSMPAFPGR